MVKIDYKSWKWYHWPLSEEQYVKWQQPANLLLRIKIVTIIFFALSAYLYFYVDSPKAHRTAFAILTGAIAALFWNIYYYNAIKSGKIKIEKS